MAWSTRQVAELAGTTVNAVRHYHRSGLLEQPERKSNGYKEYGARHLVRLLQIRRLRDLGVPLAQMESVSSAAETPSAALLAIDADLALSIQRLQRARAEIKAILHGVSATDVPSGFEDLAGRLSSPDRSLMLVYAQLYDEPAMADLRRMVEAEPEDAGVEFDALTPSADEATRQRLAETMAPQLAQHVADYPWLTNQTVHLSKGAQVTQETVMATIVEVYNEAQLDVLARAAVLANLRADERSGVPSAVDDERTGGDR